MTPHQELVLKFNKTYSDFFQSIQDPDLSKNELIRKVNEQKQSLVSAVNEIYIDDNSPEAKVKWWIKKFIDNLPKIEIEKKKRKLIESHYYKPGFKKSFSIPSNYKLNRKRGKKAGFNINSGKINKTVLFVFEDDDFKDIDFTKLPQKVEEPGLSIALYYLRERVAVKCLDSAPRKTAPDILVNFSSYALSFPSTVNFTVTKDSAMGYSVTKTETGANSYMGTIYPSEYNLSAKRSLNKGLLVAENSFKTTNERWTSAIDSTSAHIEQYDIGGYWLTYASYNQFLNSQSRLKEIDKMITQSNSKTTEIIALGEVQATHLPFIASAKQALIASDITIIAKSTNKIEQKYDTKNNWRSYSTPSLDFTCSTKTQTVNLEL